MKIKEMVVGQTVQAQLMLAGARVGLTRSRPPREYLTADLTDGTDTLEGKIWNFKSAEGVPASSLVYDVAGIISEYNGKKQITLTLLEVAANQDTTSFKKIYCGDTNGLWTSLLSRIQNIGDPMLRHITESIYFRYKDKIVAATAAVGIHHAGIGGYAYHTIEVHDYAVDMARRIKTYSKELSVDLVATGALLHDIGKIFTYDVGAIIDVTEQGMLFEHLAVGAQLLEKEFPDTEYVNTIKLITHIILSHHGELEFGSPITPKFAEAYIVHYADKISSSLDALYTANEKALAEGKSKTDKIFILNNREHMLQNTVKELLL